MLFDDNFDFDLMQHLDCSGCDECNPDDMHLFESIGFLRKILKEGIINFKDDPLQVIPLYNLGNSQANGLITVNIVEMLTLINSYLKLIYLEYYR